MIASGTRESDGSSVEHDASRTSAGDLRELLRDSCFDPRRTWALIESPYFGNKTGDVSTRRWAQHSEFNFPVVHLPVFLPFRLFRCVFVVSLAAVGGPALAHPQAGTPDLSHALQRYSRKFYRSAAVLRHFDLLHSRFVAGRLNPGLVGQSPASMKA